MRICSTTCEFVKRLRRMAVRAEIKKMQQQGKHLYGIPNLVMLNVLAFCNYFVL